MKRAILNVLVVGMMMLISVLGVSAADLDITLTPVQDGSGQVYIEWASQGYEYQDKYFKIYRQSNGVNFESTQIDYSQVTSVRCLQIYPIQNAANQLKNWVVNTGYGKGIIQVDQVSIDQFNANPSAYLQDSQGDWKYDVLFFGTWDANNRKDLSTAALNLVRQYLDCGRGAVFGHDTLTNGWTGDPSIKGNPNFVSLAPYIGVKVVTPVVAIYPVEKVTIIKDGLFNTYPNYIGGVGTVLTIPAAHTIGQVVTTGTQWLRFNGNGSMTQSGQTAPSYLTTYNNCAMIQTGHSNGSATSDEQKIIANIIFYCYQMLFGSYYQNDMAAIDRANPYNPSISASESEYNCSSIDAGTDYWYYVQSFDKNNTQLSGLLDQQPTREVNVTQGINRYLYVADNQPQTVVTTANGKVSTSGQISQDSVAGNTYLHVAAVDNAGNLSETQTILLNINVVYNKNNSEVTGQVDSQVVQVNSSVQAQENTYQAVKYEFIGWNTKQDGSGLWVYPGDTITYDIAFKNQTSQFKLDLYAQWINLYQLRVDVNGGSWTDIDTGVEYDSYAEYFLEEDETKIIDDATKIGYNFSGWVIE